MSQKKNQQKNVLISIAPKKTEAIGGVLIAFFAALMAISQMVNGEFEEEMMIAHNRVVNYSSWYQSKSIKESLKEGELDYLQTLLDTGIIPENKQPIVLSKIEGTKKKIQKYSSEKIEILIGSENIPKEEWAQDLDGEMGVIIGVKQWEQIAEEYDKATKKFDLGLLFFQICIVLGAVCIIIYDSPKLQRTFILLMIIFGAIGVLLSCYGYLLAP